MNDQVEPNAAISEQQRRKAGGPLASVHTMSDSIDIVEVLRVLWLRKVLILTCMLAAAAFAGLYAFRIALPEYRTTTQLALEVRSQQVVDLDGIISGVSTEEAAINTELAIIKSRPLIEKLIEDLDLTSDPMFNLDLRDPTTITTAKQLVRRLYGVSLPNKIERTDADILLTVAENVGDVISTVSERNTYIMKISVTTGDPKKSARIANRLAEIYLEDQIRNKFAATEYAVDFLSKRVQDLELELKDKEDAIEDLRAETKLINQEALEAARTRSKDLRNRVADASADVQRLTSIVETMTALIRSDDRTALANELGDPTLRRLLPLTVAGDPNSVNAFDARVDIRLQQSRNELARAQTQEASLEEALSNIESEIEQQNRDLLQLKKLAREADAIQILYETFLTRLKETSVQIGLQKADSRILATAPPGKLVAPRKTLIIAAGLFLGCLLGSGIALWRQMQSHGFRTSRELEQATGTRVLAQIPKIPGRARTEIMGYLQEKPTSAAAEAIRNLRTSIVMSNVDKPPQVIISTSSVPGEGKTTQAIALASNFAALDKRVLLVEGDIRRQTLNDYFEVNNQGGLVTAVMGEKHLREVIVPDARFGFDLLMGESLRGNAADLFASEKFAHLVNNLRDLYDYIIIDTPPVLVVPDARIIGALADAIIYSVQWDQTQQTQILEGQREFSSVGLRITGFVLSQIDSKGMKRYGYGGRYGSYSQYDQGYYEN